MILEYNPTMKTDIEIAQAAKLEKISDIAAKLDIPEESLEPFGHYKAKISLEYLNSLNSNPDGKLILVTAISPTPAGEGRQQHLLVWAML